MFRYTYQQAFRQFLKETDDYAGQREVIAEETKDKVLNDMHNLAGHSKNERKKVTVIKIRCSNHSMVGPLRFCTLSIVF